jgi:hypothetical protein
MVHANATVGLDAVNVLTPPTLPERRVIVIIQNQSSTANIQVIFNSTGDNGVILAPLGSFTLENYAGTVRVIATAVGTPVHIAYGSV